MEMALALAGGHGEASPGPTADALVRIAKGCPQLDDLVKTEGTVRIRLKVRGAALHAAESPSDPLAACAAKAVEGAPFASGGDSEFDALAEIRAAASKDTVKGAKE